MSHEGKEELLEHVQEIASTSRRRVRLVIALGSLLVFSGFLGLVARHSSENEEISVAEKTLEQPPVAAADIIAKEFGGEIEVGHEPPPGAEPQAPAMPTNERLGPVDISENDEESTEEPAKEPAKEVRKPASVMAPALKVTALQVSLDKGSVKVSGNLDKKKIVKFLDKNLKKNLACGSSKSKPPKNLKAVFKITKTGKIRDIAVTPKSYEAQVAKCLRKKMGSTPKELKPKNKSVAEVKLTLKLAR